MDALEFLMERKRVCYLYDECDKCPFDSKCLGIINKSDEELKKIVDITEKWSKEHPRKTRQSVFLEEVLPKDKADEIALKLMRLADLESLCSYTRLRELAEADKDGRVVVLPCKVGDTVWRIKRTFEEYPDRSKPYIEPSGFLLQDVFNINKTVFLTREEAESALEAMEDE